MGADSAISWTDHTFNPWIGCARVSPACTNCYAETRDARFGEGLWGKNAPRRVTSDANWRKPISWDRAAAAAGRPALVFCASLADVFEDRPDLVEPRARLFELIEATPNLIWLLLTKRIDRVLDLTADAWLLWPDNAWLGTTVEDEQRALERIPQLLRNGRFAPVRFLSCEPLLGPVSLEEAVMSTLTVAQAEHEYPTMRSAISWVIAGGESGPKHRPLVVDHARRLRDECEAFGIPFHFKQHGGLRPTDGGDLLDGRLHKAFPAAAGRDVPVSVR